jgi:transposase
VAEDKEAFIGIDVAKLRNAVAVADAGRDGEVRFHGEVDASPESMRRLAARLAGRYQRLHFCYEAGPTGYGLHRLLTGLGHSCVVVAPSLIPRSRATRSRPTASTCEISRNVLRVKCVNTGPGRGKVCSHMSVSELQSDNSFTVHTAGEVDRLLQPLREELAGAIG